MVDWQKGLETFGRASESLRRNIYGGKPLKKRRKYRRRKTRPPSVSYEVVYEV